MSSTAVRQPVMQEEHKPAARGLGWYGMVFFIASEAVFFANLFASYLYLRVRGGSQFNSSHFQVDKTVALVNLAILLTSSVWMHFAARAIEKGNKRGLTGWLGLTILFGIVFLTIQVVEYGRNISESFTPGTGVFGSTFYTITGFHGAHVTAGLLILIVAFFRSMRGDFTKDKHFHVTAGEMYWHFVDVIWIFVVALLYLLQ